MRTIDAPNINARLAGTAFGYSVLKEKIHMGLTGLGWEIGDFPESPFALHVSPPHTFNPVEKKFNILFTMTELDDLLPVAVEAIQPADLIIVPSSYCLNVFSRYYNRRIELIHLGVDHELFTYKKRKISPPFRFLWLGAPSQRKGWNMLLALWDEVFAELPFWELYLKTTSTIPGLGEVVKNGNKVLDTRTISEPELVSLYHSAHAFISPHGGEGFGLTLAEAMATGLPSIATGVTGVLDFANSQNSYLIGWEWVEATLEAKKNALPEDTKIKARRADYQELATAMETIFKDYPAALRVGKKASRTIHRFFTWESSIGKLSALLDEITSGTGPSSTQT